MFDDWGLLYRGILLGMVVAAPVGPVGLLCIRRTIQKGLWVGFATGFGAAFADGLFTALAAFGVAAITDVIRDYNRPIHFFGGALLLFIAWHTWHDAPRPANTEDVEGQPWLRARLAGGALKDMVTSFAITLANPATLFGILGIVAAFGGLRERSEAGTLVGGVFAGSALWWFLLSSGVALVRHKVTEGRIILVNRVTALALTVLALWAIGVGAWGYLAPIWPSLRSFVAF